MCTSRQKVSDPTVPREPSPCPLQANCTSRGEGVSGQRCARSEAHGDSWARAPRTCPGVKGRKPPFLPQSPAAPVTSVEDPDVFLWPLFRLLAGVCFSGGPGSGVTRPPTPPPLTI